MKAPDYPWTLGKLLTHCPSVGCLMDLCDENYHQLLRLAPRLDRFEGLLLSRLQGDLDLYLEVLEQTPYTSLVHLTYYFHHRDGQRPDPDATLRAYHDCRQVEVLHLRQHGFPIGGGRGPADLERKWRANLFLSKWLAYCVRAGHRFSAASACRQDPRRAPLSTC